MSETVPGLGGFIFSPDQFNKELIPRRLKHEDVAAYIQEHVNRTAKVEALRQAAKVVDFYDLQETAPYFERLLDQRETTPEDLMKSIVMTGIVARVGLPQDCDYAKQYFNYLAQRADTTQMFEELANVYEALGSTGDAKPLSAAIARRLASLDKSNVELTHEVQALDRLGNFTLPRLVQANEAKDRVLSVYGRRQRIDEEIDIYLGLKPGYPEVLPSWAARRLRHEVWGDQPAQQTYRTDDPRRREDLVTDFRSALARVRADPSLPASPKGILVRTCLRAVDFFGGKVTPQERELLNQAGRQWNVLSNE
jgi:hypothetical protein